MTEVRYCWLCDGIVTDLRACDWHYESPHRKLYFCSEDHWRSYRELKAL